MVRDKVFADSQEGHDLIPTIQHNARCGKILDKYRIVVVEESLSEFQNLSRTANFERYIYTDQSIIQFGVSGLRIADIRPADGNQKDRTHRDKIGSTE